VLSCSERLLGVVMCFKWLSVCCRVLRGCQGMCFERLSVRGCQGVVVCSERFSRFC